MLTRTCRTFSHLQDRFLHLVWQQLALVVLLEVLEVQVDQVDQEDQEGLVLQVVLHHLVDHHLDMVLVIVMVVEEVQGQAMVPSILGVDLVIMDQTEGMVDHLLDLEDTVAAMVEVVQEDLEVTVDHLVDNTHPPRTATHQAVGIHQDLRTVFHQVVLPVAIHLKGVQAVILDLEVLHTQDLVAHHTLDQEVLPMVVLLILDLGVLHILALEVHHSPDQEEHQDRVLQVKLDHLDLVVHLKLYSLVLPLQAPTPPPPPHQQMDLPHPPQPQAQQTLLLLAQILLPHLITHLQLPPHNPDQLVLPLHIPAHQAPLPLTIRPPTPPMVVHPRVHTITHPQQASLTTQATHHILLLATHLADPHQVIHPVVLHQELEVMVVHHLQEAILQDKEAIHPMATKEHQEDTLDRLRLVDTLHTALLAVQVVQWVLLLQVVILLMNKTDMVLPLDQVDLEVLLPPKNATRCLLLN